MLNHDRITDSLKQLCWPLFLVFTFLLFFRPVEIEDIWWHLATGRWIVSHGQWPTYDIFSFTSPPGHWILTQAPASCIFYIVYLFDGFFALKIFRVLIIGAALLIFYFHGRKHLSPELLMLLMVVLCFGIEVRAHLRPYLFSLVFLQLFLILLFKHRNTSSKMIFFIPLLSAVWINLHLEAFVYGSALLGIFLLSYVIDYFNKKETREIYLKKILQTLLTFAGYFASFLVSPYGWEGTCYPFKAIFDRSFVVQGVLKDATMELLPPQYLFSPEGIWIFLPLMLTIAAIAFNKKRQVIHILLLAFSFFLFLYTQRARTLFIFCSAYTIIDSVRHLELKNKKGTILLVCLTLFFLLNIPHLFNRKVFVNGWMWRDFAIALSPYTPTAAVNYLKAHQLSGNLLNWDGYGGFLIWEGHPRIKPFVDGRQATPELYVEYARLLGDPAKYFPALDQKYHFDYLLLDGNFGSTNTLMDFVLRQPQWRLVFLEGASVLFARDPESKGLRPLRIATGEPHLAAMPPPPQRSALARFLDPDPYFIDELEEGIILLKLGFPQAALKKVEAAYDHTGSVKVFNILRRHDEF